MKGLLKASFSRAQSELEQTRAPSELRWKQPITARACARLLVGLVSVRDRTARQSVTAASETRAHGTEVTLQFQRDVNQLWVKGAPGLGTK